MAQITGTKAAFAAMISEPAVNKKLGVNRSTVSGWKQALAEDRNLTIDKMEEMLLRYGATVLQEKIWEI